MEAVLLAGGKGTRLMPLTRTRSKAMVPLVGRPIVDYVLDMLPPEVDTVLTSLRPEQKDLIDHLKKRNDRKYVFFPETEPLGTGGAVGNCGEGITGTFLVLNADSFQMGSLSSLIHSHRHNGGVGTMMLFESDNPREYGIAEMEAEGRITCFREKPAPGETSSRMANAGVYVLKKDVLNSIGQGCVSLERDIFPGLINSGVYGHMMEHRFLDAGTLHAYLASQHYILRSRGRTVVYVRGCVTPRGHFGENICLGGRVELAETAYVANSALLDGARAGAEARIEYSIIGQGCTINKGAEVCSSILGDGVVVEEGEKLRDARLEPKNMAGMDSA